MRFRLTCLSAILLIAGAAAAGAQAPPAAAAPNAASAANNRNREVSEFIELQVEEHALPNGARDRSNLISISLDDVELGDVVRMFGRISGANIISTPGTLTARVTASLQDVEWKPALTSILAMHGMMLLERPPGSGVFSVVERQPDAPEPMRVETLFLKYTTVADVEPVIRGLVGGQGAITTFPSRGAIVIRATEGALNEVKDIVATIDIQSRQVSIETQFMELSDQASRQLGIKWDSLEDFSVGFQAGPFTQTRSVQRGVQRADTLDRADSRAHRDVNVGLYDVYGDRFPADMGRLDVQPPGPDQAVGHLRPRTVADDITVSQAHGTDIAQTFTRTITENSAAILNMDGLNLVLSALKRTDGVSIISNPKMIVTSGSTDAFFSVGEREPIIRQTVQRGTAESPGDVLTAQLDTAINTEFIRSGYLHTGIELQVVPTVKTDDLIEAIINPSLRRKIGDKTVEGNTWPLISVKEMSTLFTLSSGQTVAIGGLTDSRTEKQTSKIPLLGDIPIIGRYLFSHSRDVERQTETIIFVTLSLADPMELAKDSGIPERASLVHRQIQPSGTGPTRRPDADPVIEDAPVPNAQTPDGGVSDRPGVDPASRP